jgi:hypothetical protein
MANNTRTTAACVQLTAGRMAPGCRTQYVASMLEVCVHHRTCSVEVCVHHRTCSVEVCVHHRTCSVEVCVHHRTCIVEVCVHHRTWSVEVCVHHRTCSVEVCVHHRTCSVACRLTVSVSAYHTTPQAPHNIWWVCQLAESASAYKSNRSNKLTLFELLLAGTGATCGLRAASSPHSRRAWEWAASATLRWWRSSLQTSSTQP